MNLLVKFAIVILLVDLVAGLSRRCYQCRSRGKDGDCKDPFGFNETTIAESGIHISPCPSGWCSKFIEGISGPPDEYGTATDRGCLLQPPSDEEERCAKIVRNSKPTYVCFCQGDLCNRAQATPTLNLLNLILIPMILYLYSTYL